MASQGGHQHGKEYETTIFKENIQGEGGCVVQRRDDRRWGQD